MRTQLPELPPMDDVIDKPKTLWTSDMFAKAWMPGDPWRQFDRNEIEKTGFVFDGCIHYPNNRLKF